MNVQDVALCMILNDEERRTLMSDLPQKPLQITLYIVNTHEAILIPNRITVRPGEVRSPPVVKRPTKP